MILPMSCHHVSGGLVSARQYSVFDDWKLTHLSRLVYRWEMTVPCCYVADKPPLPHAHSPLPSGAPSIYSHPFRPRYLRLSPAAVLPPHAHSPLPSRAPSV